MKQFRFVSLAALLLLALVCLSLAWLVRAAPIQPGWGRGLLRIDALATLSGLWAVLLVIADCIAGRVAWRTMLALAVLLAGYLVTHLALLGIALITVALLLGRWRSAGLIAGLAAAGGLALIALRAGTWRYSVPTAGLGLNSLSFALLLGAALLASGAPALVLYRPGRQPVQADPLLALGCLYALLRLYTLGPWNLGWLYATMLLGAGVAIWSAGRAAFEPPAHAGLWLERYYLGLGLAGTGLGSGAGVALSAFALLALVLLRMVVLAQPAAPPSEAGEGASAWQYRPLWLLAGALPFSLPFSAAWAGVAGALAGKLSLLAVALWAAALLAALPVARAAEAGPGASSGFAMGRRMWLAAALSLGLGVAGPGLAWLLIEPAVGQLQTGLTPFGELALWPWAGLIGRDSANQTVATLPSLALALLMLVLGALAWTLNRLFGLRAASPERQD